MLKYPLASAVWTATVLLRFKQLIIVELLLFQEALGLRLARENHVNPSDIASTMRAAGRNPPIVQPHPLSSPPCTERPTRPIESHPSGQLNRYVLREHAGRMRSLRAV